MRLWKWAASGAVVLALAACNTQGPTPGPTPSKKPSASASASTDCVPASKNASQQSKFLSSKQFQHIWGCQYYLDQSVPYGDNFVQYDYHASGKPTVRFSIGTGSQGYKSWLGDVGNGSWTSDDKSGYPDRVTYGTELDACDCHDSTKTGRYIGITIDYSPHGPSKEQLTTNELKLRLTMRAALSK